MTPIESPFSTLQIDCPDHARKKLDSVTQLPTRCRQASRVDHQQRKTDC